MEIHIIIRPQVHPTINSVIKAGCIQFNQFQGSNLRAIGTATIWWKNKYIHARANQSHSVVTIDIPPTEVARQLHSGFTVEVLKNNQPIYYCEWNRNLSLNNGFFLRINLEAIQSGSIREQLPLAAVFTRQPGLYPRTQEVYSN